jgi:GxxExxY protein
MEETYPKLNLVQSDIYDASKRVYVQLGYGLAECAYQNALAEELRDRGYIVQTEFHVQQYYITSKGRRVQIADLRIDILINDSIILELKTVDSSFEKMNKDGELKIEEIKKLKEYKQCNRYKIIQNIKDGMLINFGKKKLDFIVVE